MVPVDCDFRAIPLIKRRRMYELSPQNRTKMFHVKRDLCGDVLIYRMGAVGTRDEIRTLLHSPTSDFRASIPRPG